MTIETKLEFKEYLGLMFRLTYSKPVMIFFTLIGILNLGAVAYYYLGSGNFESNNSPTFPLIIGLVAVVFLPLSIYFGAKSTYKNNARLQERMVYEFTPEQVIIKGESFTNQFTWEKTYLIKELKDWVMIYQDKLIANIIPKQAFGEQLPEFRSLVKSNKVKAKLRG